MYFTNDLFNIYLHVSISICFCLFCLLTGSECGCWQTSWEVWCTRYRYQVGQYYCEAALKQEGFIWNWYSETRSFQLPCSVITTSWDQGICLVIYWQLVTPAPLLCFMLTLQAIMLDYYVIVLLGDLSPLF